MNTGVGTTVIRAWMQAVRRDRMGGLLYPPEALNRIILAMEERQIDLTGSKVLIVDDVPSNLDVLSQALEADSYNVLVATSGESALKVAGQAVPDVILLDVMMPGIDGYETCRRLKADPDTRAIPVLFLTARDELEGVLEGFQAGGVDYITKPFQQEEVLIRLRTHLERARLARDLAELNAQLEQKVAERTRELQQKVKDLEGRDRIAQHLLTYHTLEDTLGLVLEVICDVTGVERAAAYLQEADALRPVAGIGDPGPGKPADADQLARKGLPGEVEEAFSKATRSGQPVCVAEPEMEDTGPFAVVPIAREDQLLGMLYVSNPHSKSPIIDDVLRTLDGFALQTAVAVCDAQVQQDAGRWREQLDKVLEMDDLIQDIEQLDDLAGGRTAEQE